MSVIKRVLVLMILGIFAACESEQSSHDRPSSFDAGANDLADESDVPALELVLSPALDTRVCQLANLTVPDAWFVKAHEVLPSFQLEWNQTGAPLLVETVNLVGQSFRKKEELVTLTLCPRLVGLGTPLMIPFYPFVDAPPAHTLLDPKVLHAYVFHEALHRYVNERLRGRSSALLNKYMNEPELTRVHLHLMAIQQSVFLRLGREDQLRALRAVDEQYSPEYSRAWVLVNLEGADAFVQELR
jgi:hypothetical protein